MTRRLNRVERATMDQAFDKYLDVATTASHHDQIINAWNAYQNTLQELNIVVTIGGYRVKI